jgi:hypothetical protein
MSDNNKNFKVKNGLDIGDLSVDQYGDIATNSTTNIDLYTNNFTADGVEVWLRHNDSVQINTANGVHSWKFDNTGTMTFPDNTTQITAAKPFTGFSKWMVDVGSLAAADCGAAIQIYGTTTLPLATDCPEGGAFFFTNESGDIAYVTASGSDFIYHNPYLSTINTSITLEVGETLILASRGPETNEWDVVGGTAVLKYQSTATVNSVKFPDGSIQTTAYIAPGPTTYSIDYMVVAGGGGGGGLIGGGGGAGGLILDSTTVTPGTAYTITVGAGGSAYGTASTAGSNGGDTTFDIFATAVGGGGGAGWGSSQYPGDGGSGGGGAKSAWINGGSGTTGQGYNGGTGSDVAYGEFAGGGGGAGAVGGSGPGDGGIGVETSIVGDPTYFAGGGGGGVWEGQGTPTNGGAGGGGQGGLSYSVGGTAGDAGTGGGGGGAGYTDGPGNSSGANGGSGNVVINYAYPTQLGTGGNSVYSYDASGTTHWVHVFTSSGTFTA